MISTIKTCGYWTFWWNLPLLWLSVSAGNMARSPQGRCKWLGSTWCHPAHPTEAHLLETPQMCRLVPSCSSWIDSSLTVGIPTSFSFFSDFIYLFKKFYLFIFREKGREGETLMCERNINWLPLTCPQPGSRPAAQACALTRSRTSDLSLCGMTPDQLSRSGLSLYSILTECYSRVIYLSLQKKICLHI